VGTSIGDIAANVGKGLFAGAAGTAVMTVSSTLEMKLSGRGASQTPAQAAEKVLEVEPEDEGPKPGSPTWSIGDTVRPGAQREDFWHRPGSPALWPQRRTSGWCGEQSKSSCLR
jgi:hypothetical protein